MTQVQRVLVTGARGALGSAVCERFLAAGIEVVGTKRPREATSEEPALTKDEARDGLHWVDMDVTAAGSVRAALNAVGTELGHLDGLVHCAGGFRWTLIGDAQDEDLDFLLNANLRSSMLLVREILPGMKARGRGRIVLISSRSTFNPGSGEGPYAATKAGINALTEAVADELKGSDVTINALLPSVIDTPANRAEMPDSNFDHWVKREQLAEIIFSLCDTLGAPINGALIPVVGKM